MRTLLQIAKWKVEGLRCPDHEVSFELGNGLISPITLIQMPNGTGKTTTLELLRAALSGSAADEQWDKEKIRSLRKKNNATGRGQFMVVLLHNSVRVTIIMEFDFDEGTVRYKTTVHSGMKNGFHPPTGLVKFLRPEFVPFFVFDGELAERLLNRDHTNAQEAIEDLFQLKVFTLLITRVNEYWEEQTRSRGATEERGLNRRRNRVQALKERIQLLKQAQSKALKQHDDTKEELLKKKNKFNAAIAEQRELGERLRKADTDLMAARASVQAAAKTALGRMRDPHAISASFAGEMILLKASLDRAKLPESTAREFFEELAQEAVCVCGRPLDEETRQVVRARAKLYLGSDDVALLNAIKGDVATLVGADAALHEQDLAKRLGELKALIRHEGECQTIRDRIQAEGVADNPVLEEAQKEISTLEGTLNSLKDACEKYEDMTDTAGDDETFGIKVLERRLDDAERKLAEVTQTIVLKEKRDVIVRVLTRAQERARNGISGEISAEANKRIALLMPNNAIRIEKIDRCLVLQGQEGGSVGETLSLAYAFLATLFNRSEHQLPFVVDSPANPIDLAVRPKVAELIPKLTDQFIAFTISSEREKFLGPLEKAAAPKPVRLVTLFRKGAKDLEKAARNEQDIVETADGICVVGGEFYRNFHIDQEVNNDSV